MITKQGKILIYILIPLTILFILINYMIINNFQEKKIERQKAIEYKQLEENRIEQANIKEQKRIEQNRIAEIKRQKELKKEKERQLAINLERDQWREEWKKSQKERKFIVSSNDKWIAWDNYKERKANEEHDAMFGITEQQRASWRYEAKCEMREYDRERQEEREFEAMLEDWKAITPAGAEDDKADGKQLVSTAMQHGGGDDKGNSAPNVADIRRSLHTQGRDVRSIGASTVTGGGV